MNLKKELPGLCSMKPSLIVIAILTAALAGVLLRFVISVEIKKPPLGGFVLG
jgi:hypothetical protein